MFAWLPEKFKFGLDHIRVISLMLNLVDLGPVQEWLIYFYFNNEHYCLKTMI